MSSSNKFYRYFLNPDLRHSATINSPQTWHKIVHDGILGERGMVA
jgi:hypothetical protein